MVVCMVSGQYVCFTSNHNPALKPVICCIPVNTSVLDPDLYSGALLLIFSQPETEKSQYKIAFFALLGLCASWPDEASPEHDEQAAQLHCDHRAASHRSQQDGGAVQRDRE